ncbi:MAG: hypothetical protein JXB34_09200 [Bacteroidales bacterium]|nr:hypothetical protein [Bacteroidales bacterium]
MKKIKSIIPVLLTALVFASCTVYQTSVPQANVQARLNVAMSDLEYIKDITGTSTQTYVAGLPVGGEKYRQASVSGIAGGLVNVNIRNRGYNNALFNALESVPDADFVLPVSFEVVSERMFLGREDSVVVKVKAFKLKVE